MGSNAEALLSLSAAERTVLFVDDDEVATQALIRRIERHLGEQPGISLRLLSASDPEHALQLVARHRPHVVVVDLSLDPQRGPDSGLELLGQILALDSTIRAFTLTGHEADQWGVQALHHGAASFLRKPVHLQHLLALIEDGISFCDLKRNYAELMQSHGSRVPQLTGLSSRSPAMQRALESAAFAASHAQPVLLAGPTGVGKGVIAQAIHRASRRKGPFIRYQPSFSGSDLVSSELFGHQKGAFTGAAENRTGLLEEANDGTLFIDEVDELPLETQVLLLNVLQEKRFRKLGSNRELHSNFRLIAATNRPLDELVGSGKMRTDFFHRIAHLTIEIPSLAERREDIAELATIFLQAVVNRERLAVVGFSAAALARLMNYRWPGNVRELEAAVGSGALRANFYDRRMIEPEDLALPERKSLPGSYDLPFRERVRIFEHQLVKEALGKYHNNQSRAAESLQLDRTVLRRILAREK